MTDRAVGLIVFLVWVSIALGVIVGLVIVGLAKLAGIL